MKDTIGFNTMKACPHPPVLTSPKATHYSIDLCWKESSDEINQKLGLKGDHRVASRLEVEFGTGHWTKVYSGFNGTCTHTDLKPDTKYTYRIMVFLKDEESDWSTSCVVSTLKEPLTGDHLHRAVLSDNASKVKEIVETGQVKPDVMDKFGFTPLMQACQKTLIGMIDALVSQGAEVNYQNGAGKTSLMLSSYAGKLDAVKQLRKYGANYDVRDKGGSAAIHWAVDGNNTDLIKWIIEDGADKNAVDDNGWTPLIRCASNSGNVKIASILIQSHASIDAVDKNGQTAIMAAVINGHQGLVELLIKSKANLHLKNNFGRTAYEMAVALDKRRVIKPFEDFWGNNLPQ